MLTYASVRCAFFTLVSYYMTHSPSFLLFFYLSFILAIAVEAR